MNYSLFFLSLFLVISGILITNGYHEIDTSYNILKLSYEQNATYYYSYSDMNLGGNYISFSNEYTIGWKSVGVGVLFLVFICISLMSWELKK